MTKLIALLCLFACVPAAQAARATQQPDAWILNDIEIYRGKTWNFQRTMGVPRTPNVLIEHAATIARKLDVRQRWLRQAVAAKRRFAGGPPHLRQWLCIHRHEGAWNDRGDPYWGGLQMDRGFMRTYGGHLLRRKGPANRWSPLEQMWVAEKAYKSGRGFYPWPNTARACGLI